MRGVASSIEAKTCVRTKHIDICGQLWVLCNYCGQETNTLHNDSVKKYDCTELCNTGLDNSMSRGDMNMIMRDL